MNLLPLFLMPPISYISVPFSSLDQTMNLRILFSPIFLVEKLKRKQIIKWSKLVFLDQ